MTLKKIKKFGTDYDSDEIVARAKDVNPIIDVVNAMTDGTSTAAAFSSITVDTIAETTSAAGVTIDGVKMKDGGIVCADAATLEVDTINEATAAAGVTVDGIVVKDKSITSLYAKVVSGDSIDTAGAVTLTAAQSGTTFLVDKADGLVFTTPDSGAGDIIGCTYKFLVTTSITSGAFGIAGATTDNLLVGGVLLLDKDAVYTVPQGAFHAPDGSDDDVMSCNGGTTGGLAGSVVTLTCIAADTWNIEGILLGDGVLATPFA